ncbi:MULTISPECIES: hypothetical protein [unclassified Acidovorax]|uniref:hypothetical protein n=1 Tax=unclassified Acidovorax TaxID=2684926 RepID=UPI001C491E4F|nr:MULTISPECIES: hypothetical protein [unclassified Acidovorax]MBV7427020.1 hypothetical protein [Acidovorax sp. sif0732]
MMKKAALLLAAMCSLTACGLGGGSYASEVGWREGGKERWNISGDFSSLDECRTAAMAEYNSINSRHPGQAFSWACLKKNSDSSYESRHR